jgi:hypothetical protein
MDSKTVELLKNLSFPIESQLHVARHLEIIPERLQSKTSPTAIKKSLDYDGSNFSSDFITDPNQLITKILDLGSLSKFNNIDYKQLELLFTFSEKSFPLGIRSDGSSNKKTWTLKLVLHRKSNKWEVTTSFPCSKY